MSVFNGFDRSSLFIPNKTKQVKFFNFISKNKASLGVLTAWIDSKKKSVDLAFELILSNYFFLSLHATKLFQILRFKVLLVLLVRLHLFSKYNNIFSNFSLPLNLLKPLYFFYNFNFILFTNSNVLSWMGVNKQLFNSNFLNLTFRTTRRNIFLIISTATGVVLWKKSSGIVGFNGKHKKAPEAIKKLTDSLVSFLRNCNITSSFIFRFFFIKSFEKNKLDALVGLLNHASVFYTYIIYDIRHAHGYMRLKKQRRL